MRVINRIVIHCSAHADGARVTLDEIDQAHRRRGFRRDAGAVKRFNRGAPHIGYHYVVFVDGRFEPGRHPDEIGAHVRGHNTHSLGICLIGTARYNARQWAVLRDLTLQVCRDYAVPARFTVDPQRAGLCGHRDLSDDLDKDGTIEPQEWIKTCPGFAVADWIGAGMLPLPGHLLPVEVHA